jgi:two-component system, chemotaxis family, sensor kinase Cph1
MNNNTKYDSEFCGSLPIHLINHIQPYGVLVVVEMATGKIIQVSENAERVFRTSLREIVSSPLSRFVSQADLTAFHAKNDLTRKDLVPVVWTIAERKYLALVHPEDPLLLIEIDLKDYVESGENSFISVYQEIKYAMGLVQNAASVKDVVQITASELKRISGFDKVMVYRFDKDWNGTVIAEQMEPGMESYEGFTFPASDVPEPARRLYLKNPYRFIPTREYEPVKLYPVINPLTQSFLDLSDCNVRAVATVHLEYLKNMGVSSSMSTRIMVGDKLWGLISCHHRTDLEMSFEKCSIFEMISNIVSAKIASLQSGEKHILDSALRENYKKLVEEAYRKDNLSSTLLESDPDLLQLFNAQGAAISKRGKVMTKGMVPDEENLNEFILWLHTKQLKTVFHSDSLSTHYDNAVVYKEKASGTLVIPVNAAEDEYILLFRTEVVKVIDWGGDPNQRIIFDEDRKNYHPRNSFRKWRQQVEGTSVPWRDEEIMVAENLRSFIYEFSN